MYSRETEIRHLSPADVLMLGQILEKTNSWKKLMRIIPKNMLSPDSNIAKYNNDHIRLIENASIKQSRMATEILFEEWGTSGKKRPTVGDLLQLLVKAELFRAAEHVAEHFLKEPLPERPSKGPAAKIDISLPFEPEAIKEVESILNDVSYPGTTNLIQNANQSSNMNNEDYYSKLSPDKVKVEVSASDFMKFSTSSIRSAEIPILSALGGKENSKISSQNSQNSKNEMNTQNTNNQNDINMSGDSLILSGDIPALSALQSRSDNAELPNLSALNLNMEDETSLKGDINAHLLVPQFNNDSSSTIEETSLTPDLSMLDQSSLDDSSLTHVTETSDEVSADSRSKLNLSENNIPCLSVLQQ